MKEEWPGIGFVEKLFHRLAYVMLWPIVVIWKMVERKSR